ncbi:MAG: methyltransferase domain-containing protein [Desulfovibrionaceae bacterium]|nr:methyltransferase domain-containing protein [Desulfovibrionaceae bacterium]
MTDKKKSVGKHYDEAAGIYHEQYDREKLHDTAKGYPANYFRLQLLLNSFSREDINRVIEIGVGEGTPLSTLAKTGVDVWGFDISREMVKKSKETLKKQGLSPEQIFWGDIQDPTTYIHVLKNGKFDALMAMGVMPHIENDDFVLENIATLVKPGGKVFIEFRNKLFSLFTFNRYTADFIVNDLLSGVDQTLKDAVLSDLESRLRMDMPPREDSVGAGTEPEAVLSRFHNPFEVTELFQKHQFTNIRLLWYHYHPAMPYLEKDHPELFRKEAVKLEHAPSNWRDVFLCSAFVVEAVNGVADGIE